jgi:hypothetical protein
MPLAPTDKDIPGLSAAIDFIWHFNPYVPDREAFLEQVVGWYRHMRDNKEIKSTSSAGLKLEQCDGEFRVWVDASLWKNPQQR